MTLARVRWVTVLAGAGTAWVVACGGNVAGNPNSQPLGTAGENTATGNSPGGQNGGGGTTYPGTTTSYATSTSNPYGSSGTSNYVSSGTSRSCPTYSCGLTSAQCPAGIVYFPPTADGCTGPCQCSGSIAPPPPPFIDAGPILFDGSADAPADAPPDASADGPDGCTGSTEFDLWGGTGTSYCAVIQAPETQASTWLSIEAADGSVLFNSAEPFACDSCSVAGGSQVVVQTLGADAPLSYLWDGTSQEAGGCLPAGAGLGTAVRCFRPACTPPGSYIAHMCAWTQCAFGNGAQLQCVDIPFDFPATAPVVGTLE